MLFRKHLAGQFPVAMEAVAKKEPEEVEEARLQLTLTKVQRQTGLGSQ